MFRGVLLKLGLVFVGWLYKKYCVLVAIISFAKTMPKGEIVGIYFPICVLIVIKFDWHYFGNVLLG